MSLPFDKRSIRKLFLQQREQLNYAKIESLGTVAQEQLLGLSEFQSAKILALYSPIRNEVATGNLLIAALAAGKQVCYPRVVGDDLLFFQVDSLADLQVGSFEIGEPDRQSIKIDPASIDFLLIPGVAFDRHGFRLGYGRGYFDRLLCNGSFAGLRVGFCYDFQVIDKLPVDDHDQKVELLVTDKGVFSPL